MTKKNLIFIFISFYAITIMAQKNNIKIGTGIGTLPYETTGGWNVELQFEYKIKTRLSGFLSLGTNNRDNFTAQGRSQGTAGTETWDNSWQFKFSERFNYIDAGLKYRVFNTGERYAMKAVLGASLGQSVYTFPENVFINRGIIEQLDDITRKVEVGMLLLGVENHILITDRFGVSFNFNFRTTLDKKHILNSEIRTHNWYGYTTSGILNVMNVLLQFGYLF